MNIYCPNLLNLVKYFCTQFLYTDFRVHYSDSESLDFSLDTLNDLDWSGMTSACHN